MTRALFCGAVVATSLLLIGNAHALSFDERWKSMYSDSEVSGDKVSAKAEMLQTTVQMRRAERANRHQSRPRRTVGRRTVRNRVERHREWYKGGKKWHYVYTRRKRG